jgi:hypothetical protein
MTLWDQHSEGVEALATAVRRKHDEARSRRPCQVCARWRLRLGEFRNGGHVNTCQKGRAMR